MFYNNLKLTSQKLFNHFLAKRKKGEIFKKTSELQHSSHHIDINTILVGGIGWSAHQKHGGGICANQVSCG